MKKCKKCNRKKPLTEFYKEKRAKDGYKNSCKKCISNYKKTFKNTRIKQGICTDCPNPSKNTSQLCSACTKRNNARTQKKRLKRIKEGICINCGKAKSSQRTQLCSNCSDQNRQNKKARYYQNIEDGKCVYCAIDIKQEGHIYISCLECRIAKNDKQKERGYQRIEQGLCFFCNRPGISKKDSSKGFLCLKHLSEFQARTLNRRKPSKDGSELSSNSIATVYNKFWLEEEQVYFCAYTRYKSPYIDDFHVDHIVPLDKGGSHKIENLVLSEKAFNLAKSNKLDMLINDQIISYKEIIEKNIIIKIK